MQAYLQFSNGIGGPYAPVGLIRARRKAYLIDALPEYDRDGNPVGVAYWIAIEETAIQLHGNFLSKTAWHFRLQYPNDAQVTYLGQLPYQITFDALLNRNGIVYHIIRLEFVTDALPDPDPFGFNDAVYAGDDAAFA
jgi:hypothetical protein